MMLMMLINARAHLWVLLAELVIDGRHGFACARKSLSGMNETLDSCLCAGIAQTHMDRTTWL